VWALLVPICRPPSPLVLAPKYDVWRLCFGMMAVARLMAAVYAMFFDTSSSLAGPSTRPLKGIAFFSSILAMTLLVFRQLCWPPRRRARTCVPSVEGAARPGELTPLVNLQMSAATMFDVAPGRPSGAWQRTLRATPSPWSPD